MRLDRCTALRLAVVWRFVSSGSWACVYCIKTKDGYAPYLSDRGTPALPIRRGQVLT